MRRHELDLTSLVAGLVFVGIAVAYLVGAYTSVHVDAGWVLPIGLVGLGLAGLGGTLRAGLRSDDDGPDQPPRAMPDGSAGPPA